MILSSIIELNHSGQASWQCGQLVNLFSFNGVEAKVIGPSIGFFPFDRPL